MKHYLIYILWAWFVNIFQISCKSIYVLQKDPAGVYHSMLIVYPTDPVAIKTTYNFTISFNSNAPYFLGNITLNSNMTILFNSTQPHLQFNFACNKTGLNSINVNVTNLYLIYSEFYVFGFNHSFQMVDFIYKGCFLDSKSRDIRSMEISSTTSNSIENCTDTCSRLQTNYAGVQTGYQCFCDDRYGTKGIATKCTTRCSGNLYEICGGSWANSVYNIIYGSIDIKCSDSNVKQSQTVNCTINVQLTGQLNWTLEINFGNGTNFTLPMINNTTFYSLEFSQTYTSRGSYLIEAFIYNVRFPLYANYSINVTTTSIYCSSRSIYTYEVFTLTLPVYQDTTIDFNDSDVRILTQNKISQYEQQVILRKFYYEPGTYTVKIYDSTRSNNAYCFYTVTKIADIQFDNQNETVRLLSGTSDLTDCLTNCSNSGYCSLVTGSKYECTCYDGFIGKYCEYEKKPCQLPKNVCLNDGVCIDIITNDTFSYECYCTGPFIGRRCETRKSNICENRTCSWHGYCFLNKTSTQEQCSCYKNYYGENCEHESESLKTIKAIISVSTPVAITVVAFTYLFIIFLDVSNLSMKPKKPKRTGIIRKIHYIN